MQLWLLDGLMNSKWIHALSWTFMHSLWLGLLAAILAAGVITLTRTSKPGMRYNLLGSVLLLFIGAIIITFCLEYSDSKTDLTVSSPTPISNTDELQVINSSDGVFTVNSGGALDALTDWYESNASLFMLAWVFFFFINCIKLVVGLASVQRLRHYQTFPVPDEWTERFDQLIKQLQISKPVLLLQSGLVKMPVALGVLKPVILLPVGLISHIPPEQVESILLHELGHIRRKDYLVNILQHFTEAIFFFNPGMLWVSSLLRQEREACCDDIVVQNIRRKDDYLQALVTFQEYSNQGKPYVMAIAGRRQYLLNRVRRMLTAENKKLSIAEKFSLLFGLLLFSAFTLVKQNKDIDEAIAIAMNNISNAHENKIEVDEAKVLRNVRWVMKGLKKRVQKTKTLLGWEDNRKLSINERSVDNQIDSVIEMQGEYNDNAMCARLSNRHRNAIRFVSSEGIVNKEQLNSRTTLTGLKFKNMQPVQFYRFVLKDTSLQSAEAGRNAVLKEIEDIKETLGELKGENAEMEDYKKTLTPLDRTEEERINREINEIRREIDSMRRILERKRAKLQLFNLLIRKFKSNQDPVSSKSVSKSIGTPPAKVYQPIKLKPHGSVAIYNVEPGVIKKDSPKLFRPELKMETKITFDNNKNQLFQSTSESHKPKEAKLAK